MNFDWRAFCTTNRIAFVTEGPNTARGNISIKCPFCGNADPSEHMGLSLDRREPAWGCLRNTAHRGQKPAFLVAKLLKISHSDAITKVEDQDRTPVDEFEATVAQLKTSPESAEISPWQGSGRKPAIRLSEPMRPLLRGFYGDRFLMYLDRRGFGDDAEDVARQFGLHYALIGEQAWRIIFPVRNIDGELVGWTGRAIGEATMRYKAMPDMGKDEIYIPQTPHKAKALVIVEGPMDAAKLQYYGGDSICAAAIMGTSWTEGQLFRLTQLSKQFDRVALLWDRDAFIQSTTLADALTVHMQRNVYRFQPPKPYNDPGEMPPRLISNLCEEILHPLSIKKTLHQK